MMIRRPAPRRSGLSLMEVLVGFGILGVGVTCVVTLFPFSALTLGQAMKDDRTASCAITADGELRDNYRANVVEVLQAGGTPIEPYYTALNNPQTNPGLPAPNPTEPSYPVFLDPMGVAARPSTTLGFGQPVGDTSTGIPRVTLNFIAASGASANTVALRFCSQMDGLTFDDNGNVDTSKIAEMRELRYNWLWVLQRPVNRDRSTIRMQVVVFDKRAHMYAPPGSEAIVPAATAAGIQFTPGQTSITNVSNTAQLRKGGWVMDAGNLTVGVTAAAPLMRQAEFYRLLSVTDLGNGSLALEVHKPIVRADGGTGTYTAALVSFPGVADVFERPVLSANPNP
jgi:hypothetical protein